ncbi:MAG: hypothetical protein SGJ18_11635 [Pseudomonadota bacterium]|nr:hypothetical protein [Pseudomonadota bacterium]
MKRCLLILLALTSFTVSAQTIDQVKKFKVSNPSNTVSNTPSNAPSVAPQSSPLPLAPNLQPPSAQSTEQPFNFLLNPKVQKIAKFLSNKKIVSALNTFSERENIRKMLKAQLALMLVMFILRAWISPKTKTFMAGLLANLWLTALYLFVSLLLLPNFIYGPGYLDFVKEAYAFSKEFTG